MQLAFLARVPPSLSKKTPGDARNCHPGLGSYFPFLADENESPGLEALHVSIFLLFPSFIFIFLLNGLFLPNDCNEFTGLTYCIF